MSLIVLFLILCRSCANLHRPHLENDKDLLRIVGYSVFTLDFVLPKKVDVKRFELSRNGTMLENDPSREEAVGRAG